MNQYPLNIIYQQERLTYVQSHPITNPEAAANYILWGKTPENVNLKQKTQLGLQTQYNNTIPQPKTPNIPQLAHYNELIEETTDPKIKRELQAEKTALYYWIYPTIQSHKQKESHYLIPENEETYIIDFKKITEAEIFLLPDLIFTENLTLWYEFRPNLNQKQALLFYNLLTKKFKFKEIAIKLKTTAPYVSRLKKNLIENIKINAWK